MRARTLRLNHHDLGTPTTPVEVILHLRKGYPTVRLPCSPPSEFSLESPVPLPFLEVRPRLVLRTHGGRDRGEKSGGPTGGLEVSEREGGVGD